MSRDKTLTCLRQSQKIDFVCAWLRYRRLALMTRRRRAGCPQRARYHGLTRATAVGRFCPQVGHAHFSRCARILAIKAEPDLNAENFSIIVVGDVLKNQERDHEHGHSGSDKERDASTADRSALSGNRAHQQAKSDWQANERRVEDGYVGKSVFVGIAPVLDWRNKAPAPQSEHGRGAHDEHGAQPGRRGHLCRIAHVLTRCDNVDVTLPEATV